MKRLPVLLLLALAGCGSSAHSDVIDAGNAQKLVVTAASGAPVLPAVAHADGGALVLSSPNRKWSVAARPRRVEFRSAGAAVDTLVSQIATPTEISWTRDSTTFAVGGKDGRLTVWEEFKHRTYDLDGAKASVDGLCFSPDGRLLFSAQGDSSVHVWELARRKEAARVKLPHPVTDLLCGSDGRRVLAFGSFPPVQLTLPR